MYLIPRRKWKLPQVATWSTSCHWARGRRLTSTSACYICTLTRYTLSLYCTCTIDFVLNISYYFPYLWSMDYCKAEWYIYFYDWKRMSLCITVKSKICCWNKGPDCKFQENEQSEAQSDGYVWDFCCRVQQNKKQNTVRPPSTTTVLSNNLLRETPFFLGESESESFIQETPFLFLELIAPNGLFCI